MLLQLSGGVEVDVATGDELERSTGQVLDTLGKNRRPRFTPLTVTGSKAFTPPLTTRLTVVCGTVPIGRLWKVLSINCASQDDNTLNTAGFAGFYIGDPSNPMLSQLKIPRITVIPNGILTIPSHYWAQEGQSVFFVLDSLATITQFVGNVDVEEYRAEEILQYSGQ